MTDADPGPGHGDALSRVGERVARIPLFDRLGEEPAWDHGERIAAWDDWAGPEANGVLTIALGQQDLHDALVAEADEAAWREGLQSVVDHAAACLDAEIDDDAWHAPTSAAWQAAWVFCLEAVHLSRGLPLPDAVKAQVAWFERGHWPCSLVAGRDGRHGRDYVVF